jgi:hypothetical protein
MHRRITRTLISIALLFLAAVLTAAVPELGLAQTNLGTWKLNLAKSTYSPGPAPRSQTLTFSGTGQNLTDNLEGIDAEGKPLKGVYLHNYDGKFYPTTGAPGVDSTAYTRVDPNIVKFTRMNAGKVVQTGLHVVSSDGKTLTVITTGTDANGRELNSVGVYEKQ